MALTIKSSDTAVAANAVIALQEHIEMGTKVSENIRNNIELFNKTADSFNGDFKEIHVINKTFLSFWLKIRSFMVYNFKIFVSISNIDTSIK